MNKILVVAIAAAFLASACDEPVKQTTDQKVAAAQAQSLAQAAEKVGMPAIVNFQEMRMAKDIYELRDKAIATHAYIQTQQGCLLYLGPAVGYGLPYATQYSSPTKLEYFQYSNGGYFSELMPQAEPNGLFMPAAAEGTWIMLKDPKSDDVKPVYVEPRAIVSPFRLENQECPSQKNTTTTQGKNEPKNPGR